jgi:hypothetical protein
MVNKPNTPNHDELKRYWCFGQGREKWVHDPHPWTALYRELTEHISPEFAKRVTSVWYRIVFGIPVGDRKGKNPNGPG